MTAEQLKNLIAQGSVLARKYHATTTNPPYMSSGNFSEKLQRLIKTSTVICCRKQAKKTVSGLGGCIIPYSIPTT